MKYLLKSEDHTLTPGEKAPQIFEARKAKKDTVIKTKWGDALITKGNYILTAEDGSEYGVKASDFELLYNEAKSNSKPQSRPEGP